MKPIPKINIRKTYTTEFDGYSTDYQQNLGVLINKIEKENNPISFRNEFLAVVQLYFDGIIEMESNKIPQRDKIWLQQEEILNKLCLSGKKCIGSFYRGEGIDFDGVKEIFLPYTSKIYEYSRKGPAKYRHLNSFYETTRVQSFGLMLNKLANKKKIFDSLIGIASGCFEPSFLAMDITGKELTLVRYSTTSGHRDDTSVKIPKLAKKKDYIIQKVKGKKVLVIEDILSSGKTFVKVMEYTSKMKPSELYGLVVKNCRIDSPDSNLKLIEKKLFVCKYEEQY